MSNLVAVAFAAQPSETGEVSICGLIVPFFQDPDGSTSWLAEVSEEQAAFLDNVAGYSRWNPAPASALLPDMTWTVMGLVAFAQDTYGLTLAPKLGKAGLIAAIQEAAGAASVAPATNAPAVDAEAPVPPAAPAEGASATEGE